MTDAEVEAVARCKHANHEPVESDKIARIDIYECNDCGHRWRRAWDDRDPRALDQARAKG